MSQFHRRHFLASTLALLAAPALNAAPRTYVLGPKGATITYIFQLNNAAARGTVPVGQIDMRIDPANLTRSQIDVTADVRRAQTGLVFATQALKGPQVLNAARFPKARFRSTRVLLGQDGRLSSGAALEGELTLRGVTRPIRLDANVYRPKGSAPDDLSSLEVRLKGNLSRSTFGAIGYPDLVKDRVDLEITADIRAT